MKNKRNIASLLTVIFILSGCTNLSSIQKAETVSDIGLASVKTLVNLRNQKKIDDKTWRKVYVAIITYQDVQKEYNLAVKPKEFGGQGKSGLDLSNLFDKLSKAVDDLVLLKSSFSE